MTCRRPFRPDLLFARFILLSDSSFLIGTSHKINRENVVGPGVP
jgi:hypothetical protein